jgi:NADPH:quinone reductase-like Zn-dependent oxidoreductase
VIVWSQARGTYAQYVAVPADTIAHKPDSLSFAEAAGVAHAALRPGTCCSIRPGCGPGQSVLVLGGAGGVGSAAVQIARNAKGARVIATASARNADYLKALGADTVIDYSAQHFEDQLRNIDIAINTVDLDNAYRALAVVRRGGYLLSSVGLPAAAQCAARVVTCSGRTLTARRTRWCSSKSPTGRRRVASRSISTALSSSPRCSKAWQYSEAGHTRGKSVIRIDD